MNFDAPMPENSKRETDGTPFLKSYAGKLKFHQPITYKDFEKPVLSVSPAITR